MIKELYLKYKEIINYLIVGVLTTVVSLTVYYGLVLTVLNPKNPIQLVAFAYWANRKFVFESKSKEIVKEAGAFVTARVGTLVMDMVFMFVTVSLFGMNDKVAKLLDQVMVTIANYVFSKLFVFKDKQG